MSSSLRIDTALPLHPKWLALSDEARSAWIELACWAVQWQTDGLLPDHRLAALPSSVLGELRASGLVEDALEGARLHDFLDYNPSRAQVEGLQRARSEHARKAANARWARRNGGGDDGE